MISKDDYIGRCRAMVIEFDSVLPADEVEWAMHMIDHGEAPEGMCSLAWSIDKAGLSVTEELIGRLRDLVGGLVPDQSMPQQFRAR